MEFLATKEMIDCFKSIYVEGNNESLQKALMALKEKGFSQMAGVGVLMKVAAFSFTEANSIVLNSKAWN